MFRPSLFIAAFSVSFLTFSSLCLAALSEGIVEIKKGQKVYYNASIDNAEESTVILLPGVFRGIQKEDEITQVLRDKKINYVAIHFSGHPKSVAHYEANETPVFSGGKGLTSKMLAEEVEAVVKALEIQHPIPVSLSYSTTVMSYLDPSKFAFGIEAAPMGLFGEDDPQGHALRQQWADWIKMFPIWGPIWVETAKNTAYRTYWSKVAYERAPGEAQDKPITNINNLTEGYMAMARAAEDFDLRKQDFANTIGRIWVLAEKEDAYRLKIQNEAIAISNKSVGKSVEPIIIPKSGHAIPMDEPQLYGDVLEMIINKLGVKKTAQESLK